VSRVLKAVALLLATLWLPATVHCQLEGVGLDSLFACADTAADVAHADGNECADDGCQTLESGQVAVSKSRIDIASLAPLACTCHFCLFEIPALQPAPEIFAARQDETLPLQRTWQFARRAALPARAPGLNALRA
jgi:hypothetical protein